MIDSSTAPPPAAGTDIHVPDQPPQDLTALEAACIYPHTLPNGGEPLPPACMNGTCACPSAPDGADQHNPPPVDACSRKGCGQPRNAHELGGFCT